MHEIDLLLVFRNVSLNCIDLCSSVYSTGSSSEQSSPAGGVQRWLLGSVVSSKLVGNDENSRVNPWVLLTDWSQTVTQFNRLWHSQVVSFRMIPIVIYCSRFGTFWHCTPTARSDTKTTEKKHLISKSCSCFIRLDACPSWLKPVT